MSEQMANVGSLQYPCTKNGELGMTRGKQIMLSALVLVFCVLTSISQQQWKRFKLKDFSVPFPESWVQFGVSTDRLQILSSSGGAEGVVIERSQAAIVVMAAHEYSTRTLKEVMDYYVHGAPVLLSRDVPSVPAEQGCNSIKEVISRVQPVSPDDTPIKVPYMVYTQLFCEANGIKIVTLLRNWEGDKRQNDYQKIAEEMTKGILLTKQDSISRPRQ